MMGVYVWLTDLTLLLHWLSLAMVLLVFAFIIFIAIARGLAEVFRLWLAKAFRFLFHKKDAGDRQHREHGKPLPPSELEAIIKRMGEEICKPSQRLIDR
jgi:hypothetical protein